MFKVNIKRKNDEIHELLKIVVFFRMTLQKTVFVTGGAGYIGSHCIIELLNANYNVIVVDNFANSIAVSDGNSAALKRVENITGKKVTFYMLDLLDKEALMKIFEKVRNKIRTFIICN